MELKEEYRVNVKLIVLIFFAFLCGLSFYCYKRNIDVFNISSFIKETNVQELKSILESPITMSIDSEVIPYGKEILLLDKNGINSINSKGEKQWNIQYSESSSISVVNNKYIMIYEKNDSNLFLYEQNKLIYKKSFDIIKNANMNENGYVWVHSKKNSESKITVLSETGQVVFEYSYLEDEYIIDVDISKDNTNLSVALVLLRNNKLSSRIDTFELSKKLNNIPISLLKNDIIISDVKIFDNGAVVAVSDMGVIRIDSSGQDKLIKNFENIKVYKCDISSRNYIVLEVNTPKKFYLNGKQVIVIDSEGETLGKELKISQEIKFLDVHNDYFLLCDSKKLYSISNGNVIWEYFIDSKVKGISAFKDVPQIIFSFRDKLDIFEIN